jgi:hypothetical protein
MTRVLLLLLLFLPLRDLLGWAVVWWQVRTQLGAVKGDAAKKLRGLFSDYDRSKDGSARLVRREVRLCLEEMGCELSNDEVRT